MVRKGFGPLASTNWMICGEAFRMFQATGLSVSVPFLLILVSILAGTGQKS